MSDMTDEQTAAMLAAHTRLQEALQEYIDAIGTPGEPEVVDSAVVLFEARGMTASGLTSRTSFVVVEGNALTSMLGMLDIAGGKLEHHLRCSGGEDC